MDDFDELERKGLLDAFELDESDAFEARFNLIGFFETLHKIDKRLKEEAGQKKEAK